MSDLESSPRAESFERLYQAHYPAIHAYARRRTDETIAQEVAAETFLVAWRRLDDAITGGRAWLYRTAHLTLQNQLRRQQRQMRVQLRMARLPPEEVTDTATTYSERALIADALADLSDTDQELVLLVYWEQLDTKAAAKVIGCSAATAAVRLHRARRRLRQVLTSPLTHANSARSQLPEVTQ